MVSIRCSPGVQHGILIRLGAKAPGGQTGYGEESGANNSSNPPLAKGRGVAGVARTPGTASASAALCAVQARRIRLPTVPRSRQLACRRTPGLFLPDVGPRGQWLESSAAGFHHAS